VSFLKIKLRSPIVIVIGLFFVSQLSSAQVSEEKSFFYQADSFSQARLNGMMTSTVSGSAISITILSKQWYSDYETVPFHWFNDNDQWLLMDKLGHGVTSYYGGVYGYNALRWTGLSEKKSLLLGGGYGFLFLLSTELMDGFSSGWGASPGDFIANGLGTALFIGQQHFFNRQIVTPKFSFWQSDYSKYRPEILGTSLGNEWLKDYNGQVYWLSFSPWQARRRNGSYTSNWISVAFGYSGDGMLGGSENPIFNQAGESLPYFDRKREFYLSVDLNLQNIRTKSAFWNMVIKGFSFVKIPTPALILNGGKLGFVPII